MGLRGLIEARSTSVRRFLAFWPGAVNPELRGFLGRAQRQEWLEHNVEEPYRRIVDVAFFAYEEQPEVPSAALSLWVSPVAQSDTLDGVQAGATASF